MKMFSWLSCENFCQRASLSCDGELKWYKRPGYLFHYILCFSCRRYRSQVDVVNKTICGCREELYEVDSPTAEDTLSDKSAVRIKDLLSKELSQGGGS